MPTERTTTRHDVTAALDEAEERIQTARLDAIEGEHHDALAAIIEARQSIEYAERAAIARYRQNGASWAHVGSLYGITRSAAFQRFGSGS